MAGAQLGLFCEVATLAETPAQTEAQSVEVPAHRRSRDKRAPLPAELPRVDIVHELSEAERLCPHDGEWLEAFAEETSE